MATKPAFAQGAQVEHGKFGLGSVLSCNEEYIVIKWDDHGEKKFVLSIVLPNLKKSDRTPPVEKRRSTRKKVAPVAHSVEKLLRLLAIAQLVILLSSSAAVVESGKALVSAVYSRSAIDSIPSCCATNPMTRWESLCAASMARHSVA